MRLSYFFVAGGVALLSGCQVNDNSQTDDKQTVAIPKTMVDPVTGALKMGDIVVRPPQVVVETLVKDAKPHEVDDVWQRIRMQMTMPIPDAKLVNHYRDWYIKNPSHLAKISQRAVPFMHLIVEEIEKRNLPIELALLPIVESAFDPHAFSPSAASGLWQFTSPMAIHFGLKSDWWYDGRRDVYASTIAALDMLEYLHGKTFQEWTYAVAAYNTGEGRVRNAVRHNQEKGLPTEFYHLKLPKETEHYVPQLLALADVIKNAKEYGIKLEHISNKPTLKAVETKGQIDLEIAAKMAAISVEDLRKYNPGVTRWATSPEGPHHLLLPVDSATGFNIALANLKPEERLQWVRYKVRPGDSIGLIAQKYNSNVQALKKANKMKSNTIYVGKHLMIPVAGHLGETTPETMTLAQKKRSAQTIQYKVKSGDTLWDIARKYKVSIAQLSKWNRISAKSPLSLGQQLTIYPKNQVAQLAQNKANRSNAQLNNTENNTETAQTSLVYRVKSGDTLWRIARNHDIRVAQLTQWNNISQDKPLRLGQELTILQTN